VQTLKNNLNDDWIDWSVEVRDPEGTKYFSLSVGPGQQASTEASEVSVLSVKNRDSLLIIEDAPIHSAIISHIADKVGFVTTEAYSYKDAREVNVVID
jgi:hypothetical protein